MPITHQQVPRPRRRRRRSALARFGILLATIGCLVLAAGAGPAAAAPPALATPPFYLPEPDHRPGQCPRLTEGFGPAGTRRPLQQSARDHVRGRMSRPSTRCRVRTGRPRPPTSRVSAANNLLFAVATVDHAYGYARPNDFRLTQAQMDSINSAKVEPKLQQGDWAGATIAAANGYQNALAGSSSGGTGSSGSSSSHANLAWVWLLLLVAVVVAGFLWFRSRFRGAAGASGGPGGSAAPQNAGPPPEPYDAAVRAQRQRAHPDRQRRAGQQERAGPRRGRVRRGRPQGLPHRV